MTLLLTASGSYPRVGEGREKQRLRRAHAAWERDDLSDEELEEVARSVTREVIEEQIEAGLDIVTDGQIRWYDLISHMARSIGGMEIDGLLRYFDTNFYFRQPVVTGRISWKQNLVLDEFQLAKGVSAKPVKAVLTGPYTLAVLSIREASEAGSHRDLARDLIDVLAAEVRGLATAGAPIIQFDDPCVVNAGDDFDLVRELYQDLSSEKGKSALQLSVFFGDAVPIYDRLQTLPVDILGLDFTYSPRLGSTIRAAGTDKALALGLIDGRNTRLEQAEDLIPVLDEIGDALEPHDSYLSPSCGLEFLPRRRAFEKLARMREIRDAYVGGGAQ